MPRPTADFIFDFASPNAYLCHQVLPALAKRTGAEFNYIPCLLGGIFKGTGNQAPMLAFGNIRNKLEYEQLETMRFVRRHQLDQFSFNPHFPITTLQVMRACLQAQHDGFLGEYIDIVAKAMWEDGLKMDEPEVISSCFEQAGFDAAKLMASMQNPDIKAELIANTTQAVERGAFGIPTFFVGNEMFFGKERLQQLEELLTGYT